MAGLGLGLGISFIAKFLDCFSSCQHRLLQLFNSLKMCLPLILFGKEIKGPIYKHVSKKQSHFNKKASVAGVKGVLPSEASDR